MPDQQPAYDIARLRDQFGVTRQGLKYFNHAGMSPVPDPVKAAMINATELIASQGGLAYGQLLEPLMARLPQRVASLVNAQPHEVTFVQNTSLGINLIAQSLPLTDGDSVILCDVEFPANVYPWLNLGSKGVRTRIVPAVDGGLTVETIDAARDASTRVVAVSAVQFFTGRREDLGRIGQYCRDNGLWLVVDAIQAAGIVPLDMQAMGIHALAAGGQKALCAAPGQGFMVIRDDLVDVMQPVCVGPLSVLNWEHWLDYDLSLQPGAARFNLGTVDIVGLAALDAALELLLSLGIGNIADWVAYLSTRAITQLAERGFEAITPPEPERHANIVTFRWEGDAAAAVAFLQEHGAILTYHLDAQGDPYLRLSSHCYNTEAELDDIMTVLGEYANGNRQR